MTNFLDFVPVFTGQTINAIRARLNADANPALTPDDPAYLDPTAGGFWFDNTQAPALEIERLWDALSTEIVMSMFVGTAWGPYLDLHGETIGVGRKAAAPAHGTVTFTGLPATFVPTGTRVATIQQDPASVATVFATTTDATITGTGAVDVEVEAVDPGTAGNLPPGALTVLLSPITAVAAVSNAAATFGGEDAETDEPYRGRLLLAFSEPHGAGTIADYKGWALAYVGVGGATVDPLWSGPGTVRVVVVDSSNQPVATAVVAGLQAELDPAPGLGHGLAPVGATVTVVTPALLTVAVAATLTLLPTYSVDGSGGTVNITPSVTDAILAYFASLAPGDDVVLERVKSAILSVEGVYDVVTATLNGTGANVAVDTLHIAQLGTVTLS